MNPKKKIIKFKKEIGIIADEKMVSEEYVKEAFVDLQDWSMCSLGCPLLPVPRNAGTNMSRSREPDFYSEHPKFSSSVWNFKSKNEADEGTTMMPPYSRERKHRIAVLQKYFWLKLSHLMIHRILKIELIGSSKFDFVEKD